MNYPAVPDSSPEFCFRAASCCRLCILHIEVLVQMAGKRVLEKTLLHLLASCQASMCFSRNLLSWIVL